MKKILKSFPIFNVSLLLINNFTSFVKFESSEIIKKKSKNLNKNSNFSINIDISAVASKDLMIWNRTDDVSCHFVELVDVGDYGGLNEFLNKYPKMTISNYCKDYGNDIMEQNYVLNSHNYPEGHFLSEPKTLNTAGLFLKWVPWSVTDYTISEYDIKKIQIRSCINTTVRKIAGHSFLDINVESYVRGHIGIFSSLVTMNSVTKITKIDFLAK